MLLKKYFVNSIFSPWTLETTFMYMFGIMMRNARTGIALKVEFKRYNKMEPFRRQIQDLSRRQDDFIRSSLGKFRKLVQIRIAPINGTVSGTGMSLGVECQFFALIGMGQNVASTATQNSNGIATAVEMVFGNHTLHPKATVNAVCVCECVLESMIIM